jgi:flavin reductase (DIM6/NTAB) family NADH-FMN oxidoreductase RutF
MADALVELQPRDLRDNAFQAIGQDWMLITAATPAGYNTMTASWGAWGELWDRRVCFCFVRPQRHTYTFMEQAAFYTLSFFDEAHRAALDFCGAHSGRDVDKIAATGLTPVRGPKGIVYFEQARLVFVCRKLYRQSVDPACFVDPALPAGVYPKHDYHRMYVGEVARCLARRPD